MTAPSRAAVLDRIEDYFFARRDTYARSYLKSDGSMGYSPACGCSPNCHRGSHCPNWTPLPVTGDVIYRHLKAEGVRPQPATIGSYGVSPKDESRWVCLDVDAHDKSTKGFFNARQAVKMLLTTLRDENFPGYVEHSGGGFHIWTFTETPAGIAHRAGKALVQKTLEGYEYLPAPVEVYPKQGSIDAFGNLVKLPLGRHYTGRRTVFVDPATFEPVADQWGYLLDFTRVQGVALARLAQQYQPVQKTLPVVSGGSTEGVQMGPPCVANMLRASLADGDGRNNILFQLGVALRRGGLVDEESLLLVLEPWNERQQVPLPASEFRGTIRQIMRNRGGYGCEKDYITPYCEADNCPIFLGQQRRAQEAQKSAPAQPEPAPKETNQPQGVSVYRQLQDWGFPKGFRYDSRLN